MEIKKKRKVWPIVLIIIVVLIGAGIFALNQLGKTAIATLQGATIEEVTVKAGDITSTVAATGNISAGISEVYVPYDVQIGAIDVEVGESVVAGERLARIESWTINEAIRDTEKDIKDIDKKIEENGEQEDYLILKANRQAKLDNLNELKENREIYANASGVITKINIEEWTDYKRPSTESSGANAADSQGGDSSSATDTTYTENVGIAVEIAPIDKYSITVSVDELDILSVQVGQKAKVTVDALAEEEFEATVEKVNKETAASNGVAKYTVLLSLQKSDSMRIGMNASVAISTEKVENVLILPAIAIQEESGEQFVYTTRESNGTLAGKKAIETGLSDGKDVEITTGMSNGETVYYNIKVSSTDEMMSMAFGGPESASDDNVRVIEEGGEG